MNSPLSEGAFRESTKPCSIFSDSQEEAEGRCVSELHQCNNNKNYQENDLELQRSIIQQQKEHQKEVVQTTKRISI
jgi:hypothetical protein